MLPTLLLSFFLVLFIGFLILLTLGQEDLLDLNGPKMPKKPTAKKTHFLEKQPEPLPEDPRESQKILQILEKNKIPFAKFGKIKRIYGQTIYGLKPHPGQEVYTWEQLTGILPAQGYWPLFVSPETFTFSDTPDELGLLIHEPPENTIRRAEKYPIEDFICRIEDWLADRMIQINSGEYWGTEHVPAPENLRPIPAQIQPGSLIAFFPTPHGWQPPAYFLLDSLSLGMEESLAVLRHWEKMYGAKPMFFSPTQMKIRVCRKPESKAEALQLAYEQMDFCGDLFQENYTSPEELAADLMRRDEWEFVWKHPI